MKNKDANIRPKRFAILLNILIILFVAVAGVAIAYFSIAVFTKHGEEAVVPKVENISYTQAVELLHSQGFNVDIRDSVFRDDVKPGYVIEQFPRANAVVKPGRRIFLYINAVHPKEVIIDDGPDKKAYALKSWSKRQAYARLAELGFKNVKFREVLGEDDRVVKILANGKPVYQMQKAPVNAQIMIEISNGRLGAINDQLLENERLSNFEIENPSEYSGPTYVSKTIEVPITPTESFEFYDQDQDNMKVDINEYQIEEGGDIEFY